MPKARVYELAKELGVDSKTVLNKLEAMGEFVKSASSTVEPPVARKLRNAFASNAKGNASESKKPAAPAKKPAAPAASPTPAPRATPAAPAASAAKPSAPKPARPTASKSEAPKPGQRMPRPGDSRQHGNRANGNAPRPQGERRQGGKPAPVPGPRAQRNNTNASQGGNGNNAANGAKPHTPGPRPGNNPFSRKQGMHTPTPGDIPRPPVVTVMGHVDHGKTRLLDTIRRTNVIAREAGGITQRIGAYQVTVDLEGEPRKITFLDTPGHEAFTAMRARGAELTDVAILVVAADDGVMPQTVEAINHAQAANVPIVVAVNKIDKPGANPDKVRGQLTEYGLVPEEYGGSTMFVDISAKQGTNVDKLLEAVLLTADAELDLRANPDMDARGATVEARLDKGRGAVATVLVQSGTLHIGDSIVAGTSYGRVRAMLDENGNHMKEAAPSTPVQVLGLTSVPTAGDLFLVASDDRTARQIAEKRQATERAAQLAKRRKVVSLESLKEQFATSEVDMLNIVSKGDSSGSVEALEDSLMKIEVSDEVGIQVIHRGVGAITQNDVNLATVDKAVIIGFNVRPNRQVADLAEREGVEIKYYSIIYKAIEDIEASLKGMLKPEFEEVVTSHSEIREIFRSSKFGNIAGVMVQDGEVKRGTKCRILRNGIATVNDLEISSLRRFKDDVTSVKEGYEAGINLGSFNDIELGDIIETFEMQEIERK